MKRGQILVLFFFFSVFFGLGLWGHSYIPDKELEDTGFMNDVYRTLQLFTISGSWTIKIDELPLQIEVVRIVAPGLTVFSILFIFFEGLRTQLSNLLVRFSRGNKIVVGLGDKSWQFIQSCVDSHDKKFTNDYDIESIKTRNLGLLFNSKGVVVIEKDENNQYIDACRKIGVCVIVGDGREESVYKKVGLRRASDTIIFTGDDGINIEIGLMARELSKSKKFANNKLKIYIHTVDPNLDDQLWDYPKFVQGYIDQAEINFFNLYELSARMAFKTYPPDIYADIAGTNRAHIAIFGFGHLGEHILLEAVRICHFKNLPKLRVSVFTEKEKDDRAYFSAIYPQLKDNVYFDIDFYSINWKVPDLINQIKKKNKLILASVTQSFVCQGQDTDSIKIALRLRKEFLNNEDFNSTIMVKMQSMAGFSKLLESHTGKSEIPDSLFPIGMLDKVLTVEKVINQVQDREAESIHINYLETTVKNGTKISACVKPSEREWKYLPEIYRKSNRMAADHIDVKLRSIRYRRTDNLSSQTSLESVLRDNKTERIAEIEILAKMEHSRWMADRFSMGWKQGERVNHAKIHDNLVEWEQLPKPKDKEKDVRERDRDSVKNIPKILSGSNQGIQEEIFIGITGHRLNKIKNKAKDSLVKEIKDNLKKIKKTYPKAVFVIMSSLAEGSDRMVAKLAMELLDARLIVPLPLPFELYIDDFGHKKNSLDIDYEKQNDSIEEFIGLIGKAERYFELPLRFGSIETLGNHKDDNHRELRSKQYALAGAFIVERCDELIVIWDGKPSSGIGGTAQIKEWRKNKKVPDEFACPSQFFLQPEMKDPIIIEV